MSAIEKTYIEFHPESWDQVKSVASNYSDWIFRGQSKASYGLETSLERAARIHRVNSNDIEGREKNILSNFQRQAHHFIATPPNIEETLEWLSIIQHHGGPTRLLDFTYSFYIACYFALQDAEGEAAVWCVNRKKLEQCARTITSKNGVNQKNVDFNDPHIYKAAIEGELKNVMAIAVEPFRKNERLAIQQGLFVFPFNITESFENNLFSTISNGINDLKVSVTEYEQAHMMLGTFPIEGRVLKIHLKKELHCGIRKDLSKMNINPATLFPGLDGFAKSLTTCLY